jgi:hypothetical protein
VAGRIFLGDGKPAAEAEVYVRTAAYLRDTLGIDSLPPPPDAVTDKDGRFKVRDLGTGSYKAEVKDGKGKALLIPFDVSGEDVRGGKAVQLAPDTLRPVGKLVGWAEIPPGASGPLYVQVYGMERMVRTNEDGYFVLPDLPAGQVRFRVLSSSSSLSYAAPALAVVVPGATVEADTLRPVTFDNEDYSAWPFSRRIHINTAAAAVGSTVTDFPLLVRLDASRFDFDLSDGKDIRFSGMDGKKLRYQRDSWDAANRTAAFWVRMDTVQGGGRQQYITLHYGKRNAPDFSNGEAVFSGFGAAWHFSEDLDADGEGTFVDASPSRADAAAKVVGDARFGAIGKGAAFRGVHSVVAKGTEAMMPSRNLTLSAWVYMVGFGKDGGELVSMGDNYGLRAMPDGDAHFFIFTDTTVKSNEWTLGPTWPWAESAGLDLRGNWHHVAGRYEGDSIRVYVDGIQRGARAHTKDIYYVFGREFRMGVHGNDGGAVGYPFTGSLDEVQMSPVVRSPAWIKLAFETQKPGSIVLEFR